MEAEGESDGRYVDEFGRPLPKWKPLEPENRCRHATFAKAAAAAMKDLLTAREPFFDSLADEWKRRFPSLPVRPGRYEDGMIFLYAPNAPSLFAMRPRLPSIKKALAALPGAPRKIELRLEIHK